MMQNKDHLPPVYDLERCADCPLVGKSAFVPGELGDDALDKEGEATVFVVGEAPGASEDQELRPFVGASGQLVRGILDALDQLSYVYITNVVKRRPVTEEGKNRKPTRLECFKCGGHLVAELVKLRPKYVLALGAVPAEFFLGKAYPLTTMHGLTAKREANSVPYTIMPTFHPAYVLRQGGIHSSVGDQWTQDIVDFFDKVNNG